MKSSLEQRYLTGGAMGSIELASMASTNSLRLTLPGIRSALSSWRQPNDLRMSLPPGEGVPLEMNLSGMTTEQIADFVAELQLSGAGQTGGPSADSPSQFPYAPPSDESNSRPVPAPSPPSPSIGAAAPVETRAPSEAQPRSDVGQALTVIAAYVPAEALAAYVAISAILLPTNLGARAAAAVIALGLNLVFVMVGFRGAGGIELVDQDAAQRRRSRWLTIAVTTWAMSVYVASIPANVLTSFDWYKLQYGGVAAVVSALVLPLIARPQAG